MEFVAWSSARPRQREEFEAVLRIAKANSARLGFMPDRGFSDRERHGGLVLALEDDGVVGYTLFDLPTRRIKLIHVCVDQSTRRSNIAKRMIDFVIASHPGRTEIGADCRRDYGLDAFWTSLGMSPRGTKQGRSLAGSELTIWRRSLGEPDLFESAALSSSAAMAVLDTNVVSDLYASKHLARDDRQASAALLSDWLVGAVEFWASPEVDAELNAIEDPVERAVQQQGSLNILRVRTARPDDRALDDALERAVSPSMMLRDSSLRDDVKHVADAINAGADYFVTNDQNLLVALREHVFAEHGVRMLRPHELVTAVLPARRSPAFASRIIESADLRWIPAADLLEKDLELAFQNYEKGERGRDFVRVLRDALAHGADTLVQVLVDERGRKFALTGWRTEPAGVEVFLLRVARGRRESTVSFQLARHLRLAAIHAGREVAVVSDPMLQEQTGEALLRDGFVREGARFTALIRNRLGPPEEWSMDPADRGAIAGAERRFWPLTVLDDVTPVWLIPIQPRFAHTLFDVGDTLFNMRRRGLGLSREHVYFRSGNGPRMEDVPARLLWYVTKDKFATTRAIAAHSRLVESVLLSVDDAWERFRHLGAYRRAQIEDAKMRSDTVRVLRFEDTTLFDRPLARVELAELFDQHGVRTPLLSPRSVPSGLFHDVLRRQAVEGRII